MTSKRPDPKTLISQDSSVVPQSVQRIFAATDPVDTTWIGPEDAAALTEAEKTQYEHAHTIMRHMAVQGPSSHSSGHPGGPLSAFTFSYWVHSLRDPTVDQPYRMSAGHLSILGYALQWLFGRNGSDERLASPQTIIESFRTPSGLPGHIEAGIGDIPFGTGPLGKGPSNALGVAFGLRHQGKPGMVDVLLADGDAQEGQVMEAFRLATHLKLDNLVVHGDYNDIQLGDMPSKTVAADFAAIAAATGWRVVEVQNGNDPAQVKAAIELANTFVGEGRPIFICYYTTMGHGISFMEEGSNSGSKNYHGAPLNEEEVEKATTELPDFEEAVSAYEEFHSVEKARFEAGSVSGDVEVVWSLPKGYSRSLMEEKGAARKEFGALHLLNLMKADDRIVVLHADLAGSGGFDKVAKELPDRVINVGVAEANMYMMAAGMRQTGLLPVTYTFAAFGTNEARANQRLIDINCGHTRCGILNDCTHAGISVGEDGETHQEQNYLNIPYHHTQVWMPADSNQAGAMAEKSLELIAEGHTSVYVFSGRSGHEQLKSPDGSLMYGPDYTYDGKINLIRGTGTTQDHITVLATGSSVHDAVAVADELAQADQPISVRVLNVSCLRPIDASAVLQAALETAHLITVEDHNIDGGLATQVAEIIADFALPCSLRRLGLRHYMPSGPANDLKLIAGIDSESIVDAVEDEIRAEVCGGEDAFVSAISELANNRSQSRFADSTEEFIVRLQNEKGYIETLREFWTGRECPKEKLPSNDQLVENL